MNLISKILYITIRGLNFVIGRIYRKFIRPRSARFIEVSRILRALFFFWRFDFLGINCHLGRKVRFAGTVKLFLDDYSGIFNNVTIVGTGSLHLGKNSTIGDYSTLIIYGNMKIGNNVMVAANTTLVDSDHIGNLISGPLKFQGIKVENIVIGDDVWLGSNCTILKGSQIGNHSIIGANSLVKGIIPSSVYAFGVPAKVIKIRN